MQQRKEREQAIEKRRRRRVKEVKEQERRKNFMIEWEQKIIKKKKAERLSKQWEDLLQCISSLDELQEKEMWGSLKLN